MTVEVGLRVVRGPDWKWGNQDDGEGHVGTVIEVGRSGRKTSPDKTVVVQWDSGTRTNYRVGYQSAFDLRIFDNAQIGVKHPTYLCNHCKEEGIAGMRWRCTKCSDFDLCTACYMADKHDTSHSFLRFLTPQSKGVRLSKRAHSMTMYAWGIFPSAKVERGPDWDWGTQDGGEGKTGKVTDIRGWETETYRSVANVIWQSSIANVYRVGHKGKVDLKYRTAAEGGKYYPEHLPVLGDPSDTQAAAAPNQPVFRIGDRVRVDLAADLLKDMQEGHGGWNPKMAEFIGKIGTVHRLTDRGDIRVQYEGCPNRWTFNVDALTKVQFFNVGDTVAIIKDIEKVRESQKGHGEWTDVMKVALGKTGRVLKVYPDGDVRVCINDQTWTFNPACCTLKTHDQQEMDNRMASHEPRSESPGRRTLLEQIMRADHEPSRAETLIKEAAQGHADSVRDILADNPECVDVRCSGKTALQVASHQGSVEVVKLLLQARADLSIKDDDGDTALHYAAFGNQPEIMRVLLEHGAAVNEINKGGCSTLHVAVNKQHEACVDVLLHHQCAVNMQDSYGDTALHDAIGKEDTAIVALLADYASADFSLKNKRGFNTLHHAALKGNDVAVRKIIARNGTIVDRKKDDGFAALHLAALNGHQAVVDVLIKEGKADIEVRNNRKQTPLLLAVSQGHQLVVEALLEHGANISAEDEDGDTCLHLAFMRPGQAQEAQGNAAAVGSGDITVQGPAGLLAYLLQKGANVSARNKKGKTPLDLASDEATLELLKRYVNERSTEDSPAGCRLDSTASLQLNRMDSDVSCADKGEDHPSEPALCMVCNADPVEVVFEPCGHAICCADCCMKMKKCLKCQTPIDNKRKEGATRVNGSGVRVAADDELVKAMERKLQEMEETLTCNICLDQKRNVAFLCGHSACSDCSQTLRVCHMCRKPITRRINLF